MSHRKFLAKQTCIWNLKHNEMIESMERLPIYTFYLDGFAEANDTIRLEANAFAHMCLKLRNLSIIYVEDYTLGTCDMKYPSLTHISPYAFHGLYNLKHLTLDIREGEDGQGDQQLCANMFAPLISLVTLELTLHSRTSRQLDVMMFGGLHTLRSLLLNFGNSKCHVKITLPNNLFSSLHNLIYLKLEHQRTCHRHVNVIFNKHTFDGLHKLKHLVLFIGSCLDVSYLPIAKTTMNTKSANTLNNLQTLRLIQAIGYSYYLMNMFEHGMPLLGKYTYFSEINENINSFFLSTHALLSSTVTNTYDDDEYDDDDDDDDDDDKDNNEQDQEMVDINNMMNRSMSFNNEQNDNNDHDDYGDDNNNNNRRQNQYATDDVYENEEERSYYDKMCDEEAARYYNSNRYDETNPKQFVSLVYIGTNSRLFMKMLNANMATWSLPIEQTKKRKLTTTTTTTTKKGIPNSIRPEPTGTPLSKGNGIKYLRLYLDVYDICRTTCNVHEKFARILRQCNMNVSVLHIDYRTLKAMTRVCKPTKHDKNEKITRANDHYDNDVLDNEQINYDSMSTQYMRSTKIMMLSHVRHLIIRFRHASTRITSQMLAPFDKLNVLHLIGTSIEAKLSIESRAFDSLGGTLTELGIDLTESRYGGVINHRLLCTKHLSKLHNIRRIWLRAECLLKSGIERLAFEHMEDHLTHVDMHIKQISGFDDDHDDGIITYGNLFKFFMGTRNKCTNLNVIINGSKLT
jgi:hypothetical protein